MNKKSLWAAVLLLAAVSAFGRGQDERDQSRLVPAGRGGNNAAPLPALDGTEELPGDQDRFDSYVKSVDWLVENREDVIVLDARARAAFEAGHIPGAVQAHWHDWSNVSVAQGEPGWSVLLPPDELALKLAALGIDGSKPVVIYNDPLSGWGEEGRQLWSLRVFGLENTYLLNGGLAAWERAGGELSRTPVTPVAVAPPVPSPNWDLFADTDFVNANLGACQFLDVREPEEFNGDKVYGERRKGRIPGAQHTWFKDFYNPDGTLQTPAQLRARFQGLGIQLDETVIAYCTGGIRSGFSSIALKVAGYQDVRNYDASFSEWAGTDQIIEL